jgi:hypothetical protein
VTDATSASSRPSVANPLDAGFDLRSVLFGIAYIVVRRWTDCPCSTARRNDFS